WREDSMEAKMYAGVQGIIKRAGVSLQPDFLLGALSAGFDQLFRAKMRSPRKHWITESVYKRASVRMLDNKCVEARSAIAAISGRSSWNFHVEEALRYELPSVLDVGEPGHFDQLLSCVGFSSYMVAWTHNFVKRLFALGIIKSED